MVKLRVMSPETEDKDRGLLCQFCLYHHAHFELKSDKLKRTHVSVLLCQPCGHELMDLLIVEIA